MENTQAEAPKLTATERLEGLEATVKVLDIAILNISQHINRIADDKNRLEAQLISLVSLLQNGTSVSKEAIDSQVVSRREKMLKDALEQKIAEGALTLTEFVGNDSFVVGAEVNTTTKEIDNPRVQFALFALTDENLKAALVGKKSGDSVEVDGTTTLEIQEVYTINQQTQSQE